MAKPVSRIFVYVVRSLSTGRRYVGMTNNLARRFGEHRRGNSRSSRLLGDFIVLLEGAHPHRDAARARERFLKSGAGREWLDEHFGRMARS